MAFSLWKSIYLSIVILFVIYLPSILALNSGISIFVPLFFSDYGLAIVFVTIWTTIAMIMVG